MKTPYEFCKKVADISTDFEKTNTDLKRQYIISNIILYNNIASLIAECKGTFGTGYPFYVLDKNLQGSFPIIAEQIRYNDELVEQSLASQFREWMCATCLKDNYSKMPDLKQICNTCPNIEKELKPRKLILGAFDHEVDIKRNTAVCLEAFGKVGAEGVVGDKRAVHDINVQILNAVFLKLAKLVGEVEKVGTHHRGG